MMRTRLFLLIVGLMLGATNSTAQVLLKDINQAERGSDPASFMAFGERFVFWADDGVHGDELWISDGRPEGTNLVKDITPGQDSTPTSAFIQADSRFFFVVGATLWVSDGTETGTQPLHTFASTLNTSVMIYWEQHLVFRANDGIHDSELWVSDGTVSGTRTLEDLNSGRVHTSPYSFTPFNGDLYFYAQANGQQGYSVWRTDSTLVDTEQVYNVDFLPLAAVDGRFLFGLSSDDAHGWEPWVTDGTPGGLRLLRDLVEGPDKTYVEAVTTWNDSVYFAAYTPQVGYELWVTDGTEEGTYLLKDLNPQGASFPHNFVFTSDAMLFRAGLGTRGWHLARTDGTEEGTYVVTDVSGEAPLSGINNVVVWNDQIFFTAADSLHGMEVWVTDGTMSGTRLAKDLYPGSTGSQPWGLRPTEKGVVFQANEGIHGDELWISNGTSAGTRFVKNIHDQGNEGGYPRNFAKLNDTILFQARTQAWGRELWVTDGTTEGTALLKDLVPGSVSSAPSTFMRDGNTLLFQADREDGNWLWETDGTAAGTVPRIYLSERGLLSELVQHGSDWLVTRYTEAEGYELWRYNLASDEVQLVQDIAPGEASSLPHSLISFKDKVFFVAEDDVHGEELWLTDGTEAGTTVLKDIYEGAAGSGVRGLVVYEEHLYFQAASGRSQANLWRTDGTAAGTEVLGRQKFSEPEHFYVWKDVLYFQARDSDRKSELWRTDGTEEGTWLVKDINRVSVFQNGSSSPQNFWGTEETLYFRAIGPNDGAEVWQTDGTEAGTRRVTDIGPGENGGVEEIYGLFGDWLLLRANDGVHGTELWISDGTEAGTRMVVDLFPGTQSGHSIVRFIGDDYVLFAGDDGTSGLELWRLDMQQLATSREQPRTLAGGLTLLPVYPNPFHERAAFSMRLPQTQHVSVRVYDALGREVGVLHEGLLTGGEMHTFQLEGDVWASGLYFVQVIGERERWSRQVLKVR